MNRLQRMSMWTGLAVVAASGGVAVGTRAAEPANPAAIRAQYDVMKQENRFLRTRVLELENAAKAGPGAAAVPADVQKLQDAFVHFEKEKAAYQKELDARDQQIADLKAEKDKFDARLDEVRQELKAAKSARDELASQQKDAVKKAGEADKRVAELDKQKADLQTKLETCAGEMANLLKERKETDQQYKSRIAELELMTRDAQAAVEKATEAMSKDLADTRKQLSQAAGRLAEKEQEAAALAETKKQLEARVAELSSLTRDAEAAVAAAVKPLEKELAGLRKQTEDLQVKLAAREKQIASLTADMKALEDKASQLSVLARDGEAAVSKIVKPLEKQVADLREKSEELGRALAEKEQQAASLGESVKALEAEKVEWSKSLKGDDLVASLQSKLDKAEGRAEKLASEKAALEASIGERSASIKALESDKKTLAGQLEDLQSASAKSEKTLRRDLEKMTSDRDEQAAKAADLAVQVAGADEKIKALQAEKDALSTPDSRSADKKAAELREALDKTLSENESLRRRLKELESGVAARPAGPAAMPPAVTAPVAEPPPPAPLPSGDAASLLARARAAVAATNAPEAEKFYAAAWQADPAIPEIAYEYARVLFAKRAYDQSKVVVDQALKLDKRNAAMHHLAGMIAVEQRDGKRSIDHFEDAVKYAPENVSYRKDLAIEFFNIGRPREAIRNLESVIKLNPRDGESCFNLAAILAQQEKPDMKKAREYYQKALQLGQPGDPGLEKLLLRDVSQEK